MQLINTMPTPNSNLNLNNKKNIFLMGIIQCPQDQNCQVIILSFEGRLVPLRTYTLIYKYMV